MDRRKFLRASALGAGAVAFGPLLAACSDDERDRAAEVALGTHRLLDRAPSDAPIDTVVIVVLENRSFDHYIGWLGADTAYLDAGRAKYGHSFHISARQHEHYTDGHDQTLVTHHLPSSRNETNPYRGCEHRIPGHGWDTGRIQRDHGFAARGSGNDSFALGYYEAPDIAMHANLARRFTVADRYFSSLLAGTFPNRQYVHAATSARAQGASAPARRGRVRG